MSVLQPIKVVKFEPPGRCAKCGLTCDGPHETPRDCLRAIDAEIRPLLQHYRTLTRKRVVVLASWLGSVRENLHLTSASDESNGSLAQPRESTKKRKGNAQ
jgi:hypothetical protein